jgi:sec-independent protein translocase protein TatB
MDFFGVGPLEIFLILILAFLFFGPEKLPGIAKKIGTIYRNLTKTTSEITRAINEEISLEEKKQETKVGDVPNQLENKTFENKPPEIQPLEPKQPLQEGEVKPEKPDLISTLFNNEKRNN